MRRALFTFGPLKTLSAAMIFIGLSGVSRSLGSSTLTAQDAPLILTDAPSFDVVSVKPSAPDVQFPGIRPIGPGGRFVAVGLTPRALMQLAYGRDGGLLETQIVADASWLDSERFDIAGTSTALAIAANPFAAARGLLQTMLRDRFKTSVHTDTKTLPTYRLVLARRDGKAGSQLRPAQAPCAQAGAPPAQDIPACGFTRAAPGDWSARSLDLSVLAANLAHLPDVRRVVRDQTGLRGRFDLDLKFSTSMGGAAEPTAASDIFAALREQLGLRLESTRSPVQVIVVDQIQRPEPD